MSKAAGRLLSCLRRAICVVRGKGQRRAKSLTSGEHGHPEASQPSGGGARSGPSAVVEAKTEEEGAHKTAASAFGLHSNDGDDAAWKRHPADRGLPTLPAASGHNPEAEGGHGHHGADGAHGSDAAREGHNAGSEHHKPRRQQQQELNADWGAGFREVLADAVRDAVSPGPSCLFS